MKKKLFVFVKVIAALYLCICLFMWLAQREIMYHSFTAIGSPSPEAYGLSGFADVRLRDDDGTHVAAWYAAARTGYPTIVFFHGNGGNLGNRAEYFHALTDAGFGLLALDYRGYGASAGSPSEEGFYRDARAAVNYAAQTLKIPLSQIVLYGESIGTGVAVQTATEFPVAAIVLQSPYTSVEAIARRRYPWLPVHLLLVDRFDSIGKISRIHAPLLLFHGEYDGIIPIEEGKALFAKAAEPKEAIYFPLRGHNDMGIHERLEPLVAFARKQGLIKE